MRRNLLFLVVAAALISVPAMAAISVEETTDAERMINSGFSEATAESVFVAKNRVAGRAIEPLYERSQNNCVRILKKIYAYIDPAQDCGMEIHHDIQTAPSASDL